MGQIKAEHVQRRAHAADHPDALAEINLGMVGWMSQRYEARFSRTQSFTVSPPAYPYSARNRSKIRLAVCRCFGGALRSDAGMASISGISDPGFGFSGGLLR
jgi:hypothetical protein